MLFRNTLNCTDQNCVVKQLFEIMKKQQKVINLACTKLKKKHVTERKNVFSDKYWIFME